MATRKDQLDAFVFARRRMVSNLVAPSPTGSDESAPRPVKTFFTSAILSAIAVAAVAVLGVFKPSAPSGWESGLAVDSSSGASYVYSPQDKELHPVLNTTSARLLLGGNFKKFDVPDSVINGQNVTIGAPFGIPGAPPDVPSPGNVDLTQWTLCLDSADHADQTKPQGKTVLEVGYGPGGDDGESSRMAFVVHDSQNRNFLVTGDYAYPITDNGVLSPVANDAVNAGQAAGPWVSDAWINAFTAGTPLQFPSVQGLGEQLPASLTHQPGTHIGDYGTVLSGNGQQYYIETADGLVEVNDFVYTLYKSGPAALPGSGAQQITDLTESAVVAAHSKDERTAPASLLNAGGDWPQSMVTTMDSDGRSPGFGVLCVNYSGNDDGDVPHRVPHLSLYYGEQLPQKLPTGVTVPSANQSYADYVLVKAGHAALARVGGGDNGNIGSVYLVAGTGIRYLMTPTVTLPGTGAPGSQPMKTSALKQLQYDAVHINAVPDNWVRLVRPGAELNPLAAGQTPPLAAD